MPNLILLTVAEKVLFEQGGKVSLIALFENIEIRPPSGEQIPLNAIVPKEWGVFAQWLWSEGEKGTNISQGIEVLYPDGKVFLSQTVKVDSSQERANVGINFQGFPIGQAGKYTINVWIEQNGNKITKPFSTSVNIIVRPLEPGETPPQQIAVKANPIH
jgi:hypothetical protein